MPTHQDSDQRGSFSAQFSSTHLAQAMAPQDEDALGELDEPPENGKRLTFTKILSPLDVIGPVSPLYENINSPHSRKASLLTQALLSSPELNPLSESETTHIISDSDASAFTRTTTPSPTLIEPRAPPSERSESGPHSKEVLSRRTSEISNADTKNEHEDIVEETLGRRRCISFACGKKDREPERAPRVTSSDNQPQQPPASTATSTRRPCALRFACPTRHSPNKPQMVDGPSLLIQSRQTASTHVHDPNAKATPQLSQDNDDAATVTSSAHRKDSSSQNAQTSTKLMESDAAHSPTLFYKSEATQFHEFAGPYQNEDEWTYEQTVYRQKITINDTLRKENVIRRLAEEAEEETLEEDASFSDEEPLDTGEDSDEDDLTFDAASDDGNESDNEEGFGDSDHASDDGGQYQFWHSAATTAATSTEHLEHFRPNQDRSASESSIVAAKGKASTTQHLSSHNHNQRPTAPKKNHHRQPRFEESIIGTLDEDRPLQDAFLTNREKRRQAKLKLIPQDIDPSFPTSDPEDEDDGNESDDEESHASSLASSETRMASGASDPRPRQQVSPRHRSPSRKGLFGVSSRRLRSPPPPHKRLYSPPPSRRSSPTLGSSHVAQIPAIPRLAQRPDLTRTASLPRSGNPFWDQHGWMPSNSKVSTDKMIAAPTDMAEETEFRPRGPIDIVQGLEQKKQRRREKYWRLHCHRAHTGKDRERKCHPGKGAQRMKEVGKEMQDRFRAYGQNRPNLMLSI